MAFASTSCMRLLAQRRNVLFAVYEEVAGGRSAAPGLLLGVQLRTERVSG